MIHRRAIQICLALLALTPRLSGAAQVVSNLTDPYEVGFGIETPINAAAGSFTTAAGSYRLNAVSVRTQGNSPGTSTLLLRADAAGKPGALLENLGSQAIPVGQSTLTYNSSGTVLNPGTTYWVTMGEAGAGSGS